MTDRQTPTRIEANLREISLIISRFAAVLLPEFNEFARAEYDARQVIGALVWKERHCREMTREQFAARYNVPLDALKRVERWRLVKESADVETV